MKDYEETILKATREAEKISLSLLVATNLSSFLSKSITDLKVLGILILKGDDAIKEQIASNEKLSREQWRTLYLSKNRRIHLAASGNKSYLPSNNDIETYDSLLKDGDGV